jgi:hypothetical protein
MIVVERFGGLPRRIEMVRNVVLALAATAVMAGAGLAPTAASARYARDRYDVHSDFRGDHFRLHRDWHELHRDVRYGSRDDIARDLDVIRHDRRTLRHDRWDLRSDRRDLYERARY